MLSTARTGAARRTAASLAHAALRARTRAAVAAPPASALARATARRSMSSSAWDDQPGPPRLPPEQQAEFEQLVRKAQESAAAASLADAVAAANARAAALHEAEVAATEAAAKTASAPTPTPAAALNGNPIEGVWRGAPPEFEGDRNPKTGEVGGPKNEPLRWGASGDWSFNGRVTDF